MARGREATRQLPPALADPSCDCVRGLGELDGLLTSCDVAVPLVARLAAALGKPTPNLSVTRGKCTQGLGDLDGILTSGEVAVPLAAACAQPQAALIDVWASAGILKPLA